MKINLNGSPTELSVGDFFISNTMEEMIFIITKLNQNNGTLLAKEKDDPIEIEFPFTVGDIKEMVGADYEAVPHIEQDEDMDFNIKALEQKIKERTSRKSNEVKHVDREVSTPTPKKVNFKKYYGNMVVKTRGDFQNIGLAGDHDVMITFSEPLTINDLGNYSSVNMKSKKGQVVYIDMYSIHGDEFCPFAFVSLCRKINHNFKGKTILMEGTYFENEMYSDIIDKELQDIKLTIIYKKHEN